MLRLCCCPRRAAVTPSPVAPGLRPSDLKLDLVADLPPLAWDSSVLENYDAKDAKEIAENLSVDSVSPDHADAVTKPALADILASEPSPSLRRTPSLPRSPSPSLRRTPSLPRSPSIRVEDYSERTNPSPVSVVEPEESPSATRSAVRDSGDLASQESEPSAGAGTPVRSPTGRRCVSPVGSGRATPVGSRCSSAAGSGARTPVPADSPSRAPRGSRDVRTALAECIVPARHEDWEAILAGLVETERLATDQEARASPGSWRAATRATAAHVRSLRSRVARAACSTLGALYEHHGNALDPELEESAAALLDRCADANRFLRADASEALGRVACGGGSARAAVALCRRGATHRAGPVRAAAAAALARLVAREGAGRALRLPGEVRTALLRAAGELLGDASAETRAHARDLCLVLSEDARFRPLLKEAMPPSRFRAVEKLVEKLRYK